VVARPKRGAGSGRHRWIALGVAIVLVLLGAALAIPSHDAFAAATVRYIYNNGNIAVISGDGCSLKPAHFTTAKTSVRRDFTCAKKSTKPSTATSGTIVMHNGDVVSIVSGDGCKLKTKRLTTIPPRYRRDVQCAITGGTVVPPPTQPPPPDPGNGQPPAAVTGGATWRNVFADEFSGTAVDATKWNVPNNSNFGSGNDEDQCYRSANVAESGGTLKLTARRQTVSGCGSNPNGGASYYFTSGMITTRGQDAPLRLKYRQGYLEVQMRVPRGNVYWSALWLADPLDGSSPGWPAYGEVDASEIYGSRPDVTESNFWRAGGDIGAGDHNVNNPPSSNTGVDINPPNAYATGGTNNWHRYGINWTASQLQWFIDGVLVRTYNASSNADLAALSYEKSIIVNLALGGTGPQDHGYTGRESAGTYNNGNLAADLPGVMEIDYVRLYQP
jgi:beta-glucanase (GH16 family)